jgi:hypothetical protein
MCSCGDNIKIYLTETVYGLDSAAQDRIYCPELVNTGRIF